MICMHRRPSLVVPFAKFFPFFPFSPKDGASSWIFGSVAVPFLLNSSFFWQAGHGRVLNHLFRSSPAPPLARCLHSCRTGASIFSTLSRYYRSRLLIIPCSAKPVNSPDFRSYPNLPQPPARYARGSSAVCVDTA
jgi:hypothetical protein